MPQNKIVIRMGKEFFPGKTKYIISLDDAGKREISQSNGNIEFNVSPGKHYIKIESGKIFRNKELIVGNDQTETVTIESKVFEPEFIFLSTIALASIIIQSLIVGKLSVPFLFVLFLPVLFIRLKRFTDSFYLAVSKK